MFVPKSIVCFREGYTREALTRDVIAGVVVGIVALPLALAFAIASGVPPEAGLYTAIIAGFLISALGGSTTQIGGPTGAFVVIVFGIVAKYDVAGLFLCTIMAGVMLLVLGATGLGSAVRFIPRPVVVGFTNGIAVLIASTQIKDFFGLKIAKVPGDFIGRVEILTRNFHTLSKAETILGLCSLALILLCARYIKRLPGYIVALVFGTAVVYTFDHVMGGTGAAGAKHLFETIGTRFGGILRGLPKLQIPEINFRH